MKRATVDLVLERSEGRCEARWFERGHWTYRCPNGADHIHHALPKSRGGRVLDEVTAAHLRHLCQPCHTAAHGNPARARLYGLMVDGYALSGADGAPVYVGSDRLLSELFGEVVA